MFKCAIREKNPFVLLYPVEDDWCEILRKSPSQAVKKKCPRRRQLGKLRHD